MVIINFRFQRTKSGILLLKIIRDVQLVHLIVVSTEDFHQIMKIIKGQQSNSVRIEIET